jgi:hypothetical protein
MRHAHAACPGTGPKLYTYLQAVWQACFTEQMHNGMHSSADAASSPKAQTLGSALPQEHVRYMGSGKAGSARAGRLTAIRQILTFGSGPIAARSRKLPRPTAKRLPSPKTRPAPMS